MHRNARTRIEANGPAARTANGHGPLGRIAAFVFVILAAEVSAPCAPEVAITEPEIVISPAERILDFCGKASRNACTTFDEILLLSGCSEEAAGWRARTHIRAAAHIYLSDFRYLRHEMLHVQDVRRLLSEWENAFSGSIYETEADCRRASDVRHDGVKAAVEAAVQASARHLDMDPTWLRRPTGR